MSGRPATTRRHPSPEHKSRRAIVVCLLLLPPLLAYAGVSAQGDDPWQLAASARMGDPLEQAPFTLRLLVAQDPEGPLEPNTAHTLRFELLWRANATAVDPAPPLVLQAAHCHPELGVQVQDCQDDRMATSETIRALSGEEDTPGTYHWRIEPDETLDREGTWILEVRQQDTPQAAPAVFLINIKESPHELSLLINILRGLFGVGAGPLGQFLAFLFWVVFFLITARVFTYTLRRTVLSPYRVDPTVGRLGLRLFGGLWVLFGVALAMWAVWRVNFWAALAAVGLISVALGFGMQNTVANIMGGVNLALDKPFVIGDRVRIGDTWGDVEEVGIRSTKIQTTKKELVIVPNKLMDEREIWNFTMSQPELRRDIETLISYDSDPRLAEALMLEAAREHKEVLPYPRPRVFMRDFADSGVKLELRCWIADALGFRAIGSDLRKSILQKFAENGVEIPFPYRTLVEKRDLEPPTKATPEEVAAHLPPDQRMPKMLYATAGPEPLGRTARFIARLAHSLDMQLIILHVHPRSSPSRRPEAYRISSAFEAAASAHQVPVKTLQARGNVVDEIKTSIERENIDLLVIGSSRPAFRWAPSKIADLTRDIRNNVKVPVLIVPRDLRIHKRALQHYRELIEKRAIERGRRTGEQPEGPVNEQDDDPDDEEPRTE